MKGSFGLYEVTGRRPYRGHQPGERFEAALEPGVERRAVVRRDIRLIRRIVPSIEPDCLQLPSGWEQSSTSTPEARGSGFRSGKEQ